MTDGRLTAAQAHDLTQTAQQSAQRKRVDLMLSKILERIADVAHDSKFSLEFYFIPPNFDLVEDVRAELVALKYRVTLVNSVGDVVGYRPHEKMLVIKW